MSISAISLRLRFHLAKAHHASETDEKPLAIYEGVPPQYTSDGLAIDCALILHVIKGTAKVLCNFDIIEETAGIVVLFNPGDVIKVKQRWEDYEVEILAVSKFQ